MAGYLNSVLCFVLGLGYALGEEAVLGPDTWAVLVAGSNGWYNYRHQADICHAYHILIQKGVKKERIITMMYDDIAESTDNPNKGTIINRPGGPDVYKGVVIDYKGESVNAENFLNILEGNEKAMSNIGSGKVLKSTKNDTIFVNFADHGATGLLAFPDTLLKANDLIATLNKMSIKNMFDKLILFIEACESGSMFDGFINNLKNVFVSTASATDESSYACYCDDTTYDTCFGDLYSISWMERLDKIKTSETLFNNYNAIRTAVNESHVQLYGDYRLGFLELFESDEVKDKYEIKHPIPYEGNNAVNSRDVPLYLIKKELEAAKEPGSVMLKKEKLEKIVQARGFADKLISKILEVYTEGDIQSKKELNSKKLKLNLDMFSCYDDLLNTFETNCFSIPKNTYFMKHLYKFANICVKDMASDKAVTAIRTVCRNEVGTVNNLGIKIE